jgi:hypothetical protein
VLEKVLRRRMHVDKQSATPSNDHHEARIRDISNV